MATEKPSQLRWSEVNDDEGVGVNLDYLLPPPQVIGTDDDGIKKVVEYKLDGHGNKVRVTTTTRVRKLATARLSARAVERRSWASFGAAAAEDLSRRLTMVSTEDIVLERRNAPGSCAIL